MTFEWDSDKEKINIRKHGIDFKTASRVFLDEDRAILFDFHHSYEEDRYIAIGSVDGKITVLYVVFTERDQSVRIISARKATVKEKEAYYGGKI